MYSVDAADTSVLVRSTIRAVGGGYNYRTSFSPKVEAEGSEMVNMYVSACGMTDESDVRRRRAMRPDPSANPSPPES